MRVLLITSVAIVLTAVAYQPSAAVRDSAAIGAARTDAQAQPADFTRPEVAPLPAEGKFQVVSETAWPGAKVRVFFLGAQF